MVDMKGKKKGSTCRLICISYADAYELPILFTSSLDEISEFTGVKKKSVAEQLCRQRRKHTPVICIGGFHVEQLEKM